MRIYDHNLNLVPISKVTNLIKNNDFIECDTETTGLDPHTKEIITIQFGTPNEQYCLIWDEDVAKYSKNYLEKSGKTFIFHNAKFDLKFLFRYGIYPEHVFDTFLAECVIKCGYGTRGKSLKAIAENYLGIDINKDVRKNFVEDLSRSDFNKENLLNDMEFIKYALDDVKHLTNIRSKQMEIISHHGLEKALRLDNKFVKCLAFTEFSGFKLSRAKWKKKYHDDITRQMELVEAMDKYVLDNGLGEFMDNQLDLFSGKLVSVNWSSPTQVAKLFKSIGIDITDDEGKETVGVKVQRDNKDHELVKLFSEYQKVTKLVTSYGLDFLKFINDQTNRIHPNFTQILNTGRMSCSNPNLQQVPSDSIHRGCFVPDENNTLIVADYSGQETVIFANKCLDKNLLKFYDDGLGDMHSYVAKLCFPELSHIAIQNIKKERPDLRQKAKAAGFAIQFGGNGYTIANNLGISQSAGDEIYNKYAEAFPEMFDYFDKVSEETLNSGSIHFNDATNRRSFIDFYDDYVNLKSFIDSEEFSWDIYRNEKKENSQLFKEKLGPAVKNYFKTESKIKRRSYNYPVQGTASDITKIAGLQLFNYIIENNLQDKVKICNIVHDEIVIECPKSIQDDMAKVLKDCMERAGSGLCKRVKLNAVPKITEFWDH